MIKKGYISDTISYDENLTVTLEAKLWTVHYPVLKFKVSGGATKVAVSFLSASEYSKGQAELYAATNNIYNATFLVDSHACRQRNNSAFSARPREHVVGAPALSLCVGILANY